jgi:hypothetical protein
MPQSTNFSGACAHCRAKKLKVMNEWMKDSASALLPSQSYFDYALFFSFEIVLELMAISLVR